MVGEANPGYQQTVWSYHIYSEATPDYYYTMTFMRFSHMSGKATPGYYYTMRFSYMFGEAIPGLDKMGACMGHVAFLLSSKKATSTQ